MVTAAGFRACQCCDRDGPCGHGERDVLNIGPGQHRARHGVVEFIDEVPQSVAVPDHRGPPGHRLLQVAPIERIPLARLHFRHRRTGTVCVPGSLAARAATDHQTLQQAVGGQPIGAVHTGPSHLAGGEQPRHAGSAVHVGADPAATVVRTGNDRNRSRRRIDTSLVAGSGHSREPLSEPLDGPRVEEDTLVPAGAQPGLDGGSHHIARRQIAHRVHSGHHRLAPGIEQHRTFTAQRLGDQRSAAGAIAVEQHGRMELDELDIGDVHTGPQRQRDPVTGRPGRVGGGAVEVAESAGGQDHRGGVQHTDAIGIADEHSGDGGSVVQHFECDVVVPDVQGGSGMVEGALHLSAGGVTAGVHDAANRMPTLASQRPLAGRALVEPRAVGDQIGHRTVAVGDDGTHRVLITKSRSGNDRVAHMRLDGIIGVGQHHGDTALGVEGGGLGGLAQHDRAAATAMGGKRGSQAGHAGADHNHIGALLPVHTCATPAGDGPGHSPPPGAPIAIMR